MTAEHTDLIAAAQRMDDMGVSYVELPRLAQPTPDNEVQTRPDRAWPSHKPDCQGARCPQQRDPNAHVQLSYVDARYVMETLDRICGPENWQRVHALGEGGKTACGIGINVSGIGWVFKWDGAGETDIEGQKGSFSDSFKRAAVSWGIGRDLYDKDRPASTVASAPVQRTASAEDDEDVRPIRQITPPTGGAEGRCPEHELPWTLKPGGISKATNKPYDPFYACAFRPERGQKFCNEKPSKAWLARQEVA